MSHAENALQRSKPGLTTPFHIDYQWWQNDNRDLRLYLLSHLPESLQQQVAESPDAEMDEVDPDTAEVRRVTRLQLAIRQAALADDFIAPHLSLVDAVFRAFLRNDNTPLTPTELGEEIGRAPQVILRTLGGVQVYNGIRPYIPD